MRRISVVGAGQRESGLRSKLRTKDRPLRRKHWRARSSCLCDCHCPTIQFHCISFHCPPSHPRNTYHSVEAVALNIHGLDQSWRLLGESDGRLGGLGHRLGGTIQAKGRSGTEEWKKSKSGDFHLYCSCCRCCCYC